MAGKRKNDRSRKAPVSSPTGVPEAVGSEAGAPPKPAEAKHGGAAFDSSAAGDFGGTLNVAGGLEFEHKRSGSATEPVKEQPTPPERAEIVEARRLEIEMHKSRVQDAKDNPASVKVGDLVRYYRSASSGWGVGKVVAIDAVSRTGAVETETGAIVALEDGKWEPNPGTLAAPEASA